MNQYMCLDIKKVDAVRELIEHLKRLRREYERDKKWAGMCIDVLEVVANSYSCILYHDHLADLGSKCEFYE